MPRSLLLATSLLFLVLSSSCTGEDALAPQDGTCSGRWSDVAPVDLAATAAPTAEQRRVGPTPGSFTRDVPMALPPHHGLEPRLSLHYDSARFDGPLGVGWTLGGVPHIERDGDRVYLVDGADGELLADAELVPCTATGGTHCTRRQSFARVVHDGDAWVVTAPDGVASTFVAGIADGQGVTVRWVLARVTDPSSRQVDLEHACDSPRCLLRAVAYGQSRVDLTYDGAGLLVAIDVTAAGLSVRAVRLAYVASPVTGRALLESITDLGRDPAAPPLVPPVRFGYGADLLTSVDNGIGGTDSVVYWPAARFGAELPFELPLVRAVTSSDGRSSWTSVRDYLGATWDASAGRFLGFAAVTEHVPVDPRNQAYLDRATRTSVDPASAGAVLSVSDAAGDACGTGATTTLRQVEHSYLTTDGAVLRVATDTTSHGLDGSVEHRRVEWEHDDAGNVRVERDLGDVDDPDDDAVRTIDRFANRALHLTHLPARIQVAGARGEVLEDTFYFYDDASDWTAPPARGGLTRVGRAGDGGELLDAIHSLDFHGNRIATYRLELSDVYPQATWEYDPTFHDLETVAVAYGRPGRPLRTTTAWDLACRAPSSRTDPAGVTTTVVYDALCRPTEERNLASGRVVRRTYQVGVVREEVTAGDDVTWIEHHLDGLGREWKTVSSAPGAPIVVERDLSPGGMVLRETVPRYDGQPVAAIETAHDALGRVVRVTHADGASRATQHTARGVETTDEVGHRRRHHRDGDELVDEEWSGSAWLATRRRTDALGRLLAVIDPTGRTVTTYEVDRLGRVTRTVDADRGVTTYEHRVEVFATDGAGVSDSGWSVTRVDAAGRRTTTQHDWLGRKRWEQRNVDGDGTAYNAGWGYEDESTPAAEVGRLRSTTFWAGTRRDAYDASGNPVRTETWLRHGSRAYRFVTERGFDAAGRLRWLRYPDGDMLGTPERPLGYDAAGRVASAAAPDLELVRRIDYTAAGQPARIEMGNGAVSERSYSPERGWLTAIATTLHGVEVQRLTVERDAEGFIRGVESQPRYERWSRHERWRYEIDELHRLTAAIDLTDDAYSQRFRYDDVGNMTHNSLVGDYRYGTPDGALPHAVTSVERDGAVAELGYDAAGNLVSGSPATAFEREILYGQDGRPRAVRKWSNLEGGGFSRADTFYDADGARVVKRVQDGRTTFYLGDGFEISASDTEDGELTDVVATKQIVVGGLPVAERVRRMGWWCDPTGTGDSGCLQHIDTTWVHVDHLGSVQARTTDHEEDLGESEHAAGRMKYRPYGLPLVPGQLGHTYAGAEQDETGLVYLGARYYDPFLARFVSPDPTHPGPGVGLNRYAYANDNPISYVDPTGYSTARPPADGPTEGGGDDGGGGEEDPPLPPTPPVGPSGGPGADPVIGPQLPVYGPELPPAEQPPLTVIPPDLSPTPAPISATLPITIGGDGLGAEDALALGGLLAGSAVVAGAAVAACSVTACPVIAAASAAVFSRLGPSRSADLFDFGLGLLAPSGKPYKDPKRAAVGALRQIDVPPASPSDRIPAEPAPGPASPTPSGTPRPQPGWGGGGSW